MKKSYLCTGLAFACALGLAACGGNDKGELQIGMNLFGVTKDGLKISNMGGATVAVPPGGSFVFADLVPVDSDYDIKIVESPPNTDSCAVVGGKGNTGVVSPATINIVCVVTTFALGGTITGLTSGPLLINNGAQEVSIAKDATTFTMTAPTTTNPKFGQVAEGTPYGLTILAQPPGLNCAFASGLDIAPPAGTMPKAAISNIAITCTPKPAA